MGDFRTERETDSSAMVASSLVLVVLASSLMVEAQHHNYILSDHFIERLNQANSTWTAGRNFHPGISHNYLRTIAGGVHPDASLPHNRLPEKELLGDPQDIPASFDPQRIFCPVVTAVDLVVTEVSPAQPGLTGLGKAWCLEDSTGVTRDVSLTSSSPASIMSTVPGSPALREPPHQNVTGGATIRATTFHTRRTKHSDRRVIPSREM